MKKIIPFKKQISFNNHVQEITSISLEHTLSSSKSKMIKGNFIISGEYKMSETSVTTDPFYFDIPCDIQLDDHYNIDKVEINIDDFYYELIDSNILEVNIDVLIDRLEEEQIMINEISIKHETLEQLENDLKEKEKLARINQEKTIKEQEAKIKDEEENLKMNQIYCKEERCVEEEDYATSIFSNLSEKEEYRTYKVYILREGDSLEGLMAKYQVNKEELEKYNDLTELNIGDKIIIPYSYENN